MEEGGVVTWETGLSNKENLSLFKKSSTPLRRKPLYRASGIEAIHRDVVIATPELVTYPDRQLVNCLGKGLPRRGLHITE